MTAEQLYEALDKLGVEYDVVEVFEGLRVINVQIEESANDSEQFDVSRLEHKRMDRSQARQEGVRGD